MTFKCAIVAILVTTLVVAAIGAGIGYALGQFVPDYYREIMRDGHEPGFDPVSVGLGQGLTQGTAGGVLAGIVVIALMCWRDVRLGQAAQGIRFASVIGGAVDLVIALALPLLIVATVVAFLLGSIRGERSSFYRRYLEERNVLAPVIATDPAFAGIEIDENSLGGVDLTGVVPTPADMDRLRTAVTRAVGEARGNKMLRVDVAR